MLNFHKIGVGFVFLVSILMMGCNTLPTKAINPVTVDQAKAVSKPKYHAPYPFTADELWGDFLKLAELPDGKVSRKQLEQAFGVKYTPEHPYMLVAGRDWYFNLIYSPKSKDGNLTIISFDWGVDHSQYPPIPPDMCINLEKITPSLLERGWSGGGGAISHDFFEYTQHNVFTKGENSQLIISSDLYNDHCIGFIRMGFSD